MSEFRDFTFSSWFAPEKVKAFVSELHKNGQHCILQNFKAQVS